MLVQTVSQNYWKRSFTLSLSGDKPTVASLSLDQHHSANHWLSVMWVVRTKRGMVDQDKYKSARNCDWWHVFLSYRKNDLFSAPMSINTTVVANIVFWSNLEPSFAAWILCIFLKVEIQLISLFNLASHSSQQFVLLKSRVMASCTIPFTINNLNGLGQLWQTIFFHY